MKNTFIYKVAEYVFTAHRDDPGRVKVIFPNRRAGLFFNHALAGLTGHPVWAPEVLTIRGFVEEQTGKKVTDTLYLVMELYGVYKEIIGSIEPFEDFYPWGEMLLGDFDDLDKYLVDARDLFRNLKAERELTQDLSYLSEEQVALLRHFWDHFPEAPEEGEAGKFLHVWEKLYAVYEKLRRVLATKEMAYEGMLYRELAEKIARREWTLPDASPVYLIGFNALTPTEVKLFEALKDSGQAFFFWDYDEAYVTTRAGASLPGHDAGRFIRKYIRRFSPPAGLNIFDNLLDKEKEIRVYSSPNRTVQAWVVHNLLEQWTKEEDVQKERIAVVLADESLLLPVLHAMPEEAGDINVTMGYPLQDSPVFSFFGSALTMLKNKTEDKDGNTLFYYKDVLNILHNPLLAEHRKTGWHEWEENLIRQNKIYLSSDGISAEEMVMPVFEIPENPIQYGQVLLDVLHKVLSFSSGEEERKDGGLNIEVYYQLYLLVNRLNDFLEEKDLPLSLTGYLNLLLYLAGQSTVTFYGEPLTGIQVMGVLETRLLDFDRVIVLSVNEGSLPKPYAVASYIPHSLRKGFGLPTYEHRDAVYAYYFYRLIQRARHVALVWHTESDAGQKGEKSRFISQLQYLTQKKPEVTNLYFSPGMGVTGKLCVQKDGTALSCLQALVAGEDNYLSPSAMNTYLTCRLRFYFKYVAGISEPEEMEEDMDAALFGSLLHRAMEKVYTPWKEKEVTVEDLEKILQKKLYRKAVDESFRDELYDGHEAPPAGTVNGVQMIIRSSLEKYVRKILEYDRKYVAPFIIKGLEEKVIHKLVITVDGKTVPVQLGGKTDRRDESHGRMRLVDYKTGQKKTDFESIGQLFDPEDKNRNAAAFQILTYVWITGGDVPVQPELYFVREMFRSDVRQGLRMGPGRQKVPFVPDREDMLGFEEKLNNLLVEMFDPQVPFDQTPHAEFCTHCPYNAICQRNRSSEN